MRGIAPLAAFAVLAGTAASAQGVDQLGWMTGCWDTSLRTVDRLVEEHWMAPRGGGMIGMSRTVVGGVMREWEHLEIRTVNGKLAYVAKPSGQAETVFPMKSMTANEAVFENPTHDFPQRIIYRRSGEQLTARVEGAAGGQDRSFELPMGRCRPV